MRPLSDDNTRMTMDAFLQSIETGKKPAGLPALLESLWYDARGDWQTAHDIVQAIETPGAALVHAYLHRKEGDPGNAAYWYSRAGTSNPQIPLEQEWKELTESNIEKPR